MRAYVNLFTHTHTHTCTFIYTHFGGDTVAAAGTVTVYTSTACTRITTYTYAF